MARVAGITVEKNYKGIPTHVRIDLKKYRNDIYPFLVQYGILFETPNDDTEDAIKESFNLKNTKKYSSGRSLLADCLN